MTNESKTRTPAKNRAFFMAILAVLVVSTMFSGGTALVLATGMINEQGIELAQAAPLPDLR